MDTFLVCLFFVSLFLVNVMLSLDETYADVQPVRLNPDSVTAFV